MLGEVQKQVLIEQFTKEATSKGEDVNQFKIAELLDLVFSSTNGKPGVPLSTPLIQQPRQVFDVKSYHTFLKLLGIDFETLIKFANRSKIDARDLLIVNDVRTISFQNRVKILRSKVNNFNSIKEPSLGIFSSTFDTPFISSDFFYPTNIDALEYDAKHNIISLPVNKNSSSMVDLSYLTDTSVNINPLHNALIIVNNKSTFAFSNITNSSPNSWVHDLSLKGDHKTAKIQVTIPLKTLEEINNIVYEPLSGVPTTVTIDYANSSGLFINLGSLTSSTGERFIFDTVKANSLRLTLEVSVRDFTNNISTFIFGLKKLSLFNNRYATKGNLIIKNIDPNIGNRPILSVSLKAENNTPAGSIIDYTVSLNGIEQDKLDTKISNSSSTSIDEVKFSVAKTVEAELANLSRTNFTNKNSIQFYELGITKLDTTVLDDFDTTTKAYIPRTFELWTEQNSFKVTEQEDFSTFEIQDARVSFGNENEAVPIIVPITLTGSTLREDNIGTYIQLPLDLAYQTVAPSSTVTAVDRMKTENFGVFKVVVYNSKEPDRTTTLSTSSLSINSNYKNRLYITGTYSIDQNFTIYCLTTLDASVFIKRESLKLHTDYGKNGVLESNQIRFTDNTYTILSKSNKAVALKITNSTNLLANTTKYLNFTGIFSTPKLFLYETYVTFSDNVSSIPLRSKILADVESGEYITLRHIDTGQLLRVENKGIIKDIKKGTYLLSVMSKPLRSVASGSPYTSAYQSVINALYDPGDIPVGGIFPKLFSMTSLQPFIEQISVLKAPLKYRLLTNLLNKTLRIGADTFSSTIQNGVMKLIVPNSGYSIQPIDSIEMAKIKFSYYNLNLFNKNANSKINLNITMNNTTRNTTKTPYISNLSFTISYI